MSRFSFAMFLLFFVLLSGLTPAQQLRTSVDWAVFDYDDDHAFVEVYYSFLQSDLNFEAKDGKLHGLTLGRVDLLRGGDIVQSNAWKTETFVADSAELQTSKKLVDRVGLKVPAGDYNFVFVLKDLIKPENVDSVSWQLAIETPEPGEMHLSEIELASSIRRAGEDKSSPFYKNSLIVEPNPSLLYSYESPALFFYLEAYNLPRGELPNGYRLKYYVVDANDNIPQDLPPKVVKKKTVLNPSVEIGMLNVGQLESGSYTFKVEIQNDDLQTIVSQQKKFYILQKKDLQKQEQMTKSIPYESSVFAAMDSVDVEKEFLMVFYLLSSEEQIIHKQINGLDAKRHFLYNFWQNKNPGVNVNQNPMRLEFRRRAQVADERYTSFKLPGWLSDRGRVYMVYGEPDDIERYPNEPNTFPYEVWFYNNLQGGVRFIFADLEGRSRYQLIHSDLLGEIKDPNYKQTLRRGY